MAIQMTESAVESPVLMDLRETAVLRGLAVAALRDQRTNRNHLAPLTSMVEKLDENRLRIISGSR